MKNKNIFIIVVLVGLLLISFGFNLITLLQPRQEEQKEEKTIIDKKYLKEKSTIFSFFPESEYDSEIMFADENYCYVVFSQKEETDMKYRFLIDLKNNQYFDVQDNSQISVGFGGSFSE